MRAKKIACMNLKFLDNDTERAYYNGFYSHIATKRKGNLICNRAISISTGVDPLHYYISIPTTIPYLGHIELTTKASRFIRERYLTSFENVKISSSLHFKVSGPKVQCGNKLSSRFRLSSRLVYEATLAGRATVLLNLVELLNHKIRYVYDKYGCPVGQVKYLILKRTDTYSEFLVIPTK